MNGTQTISGWTTRFASVLKADSRSTEASNEVIEQVRAKLAKADDRIASLESDLKMKQASLSALIAEDARSSEEIGELKELLRASHSNRPEGGCECNICVEVELSRTELEGLL